MSGFDMDAYLERSDRERKQRVAAHRARAEARSHLPHVVYRLFNTEGDLLYVGCTRDFPTRVFGLATTKRWFDQVADARLETYADLPTALASERHAIETEGSRHNGQLSPVYTQSGDMRGYERSALRQVGKPRPAFMARQLLAKLAERGAVAS